MKSLNILLITVSAAVFAGCATPYQKTGFAGGFNEAQKGRNEFVVAFNGNGYTSGTRASELCLLRCAELTLGHGFRYFVLTDNRAHVDTSTTVTSGTYGGGMMFATTQSIPKPSTVNRIICFRDKPTAFDNHFDAERVFGDLASKYGVSRKPDHLEPLLNTKAMIGILFEMRDGFTIGQRVRGLAEGSNAEKAGIKVGDTVLAFNGVSLMNRAALLTESEKWKVGDTVEVTVERGMKKIKIPVQTIFNRRGLTFRPVRDDFGNLPPTHSGNIVVVEGPETNFSFIPLAQLVDYEKPLASLEEVKEVAIQAAAERGANVVHILRNRSETVQYFPKHEGTKVGFICGLLYAPPATLGVAYESGSSFENRRVIRRVFNPAAQEAGLRIGDNVLALNGVDVLSEAAVSQEVAKWKVGETVEVTVARDGKEIKIPVKAAENTISPRSVSLR